MMAILILNAVIKSLLDVSERTESDVRIPNPAEVEQSSANRPSSRVEQSSLVAPRPSSPIRISTIPFSNKQDEKADKFWTVLSAPNMEMGKYNVHVENVRTMRKKCAIAPLF